MKQFLQCDESSGCMIVALNDRAFLGSLTDGYLWELLPAGVQSPVDGAGVDTDDDDAANDDTNSNIDEKPNKSNDTTIKDAEAVDGSDNQIGSVTTTVIDCTENATTANGENPNPLEVQSVAIFSYQCSEKDHEHQSTPATTVWCAVARHDKTLSIYCVNRKDFTVIDPPSDSNNASSGYTTIRPQVFHRTGKRAGSLCFATIPPSSGSNDDPLHVVISGDLAGDAVAFSLSNSSCSAVASKTEILSQHESENEHKVASKYKRVLLGHTASMLTGVHVVGIETENGRETRKRQFIITSDRDEKIRVSCFPSTHIIEGYLLGHKSFISGMDCSSQAQRCVSISGDGTIRLWDYTTCQELAVALWDADVAAETEPRASEDAILIKDDGRPDADDIDPINEMDVTIDGPDDTKIQSTDPTLTPSRIAINSTGDIIATIYEDCLQIDLWKVCPVGPTSSGAVESSNAGSSKLLLRRDLQYLTDAQPLAIAFIGSETLVVLSRNPHFVQVLKVQDDNNNRLSVTSTTPESNVCDRIRAIGIDEAITMPLGLLERDSRNQKIKLQKVSESRGGARLQPWNNSTRLDVAKERNRRMRKRRRDK